MIPSLSGKEYAAFSGATFISLLRNLLLFKPSCLFDFSPSIVFLCIKKGVFYLKFI